MLLRTSVCRCEITPYYDRNQEAVRAVQELGSGGWDVGPIPR
jgi:hypothetical protein